MVRYTPQFKHHILTHYAANRLGSGYKALATRFAVKGGHSVIRRWHERWDGTPASLETRARSGRPRILKHRQVTQHILSAVRRENRAHRAAHYPEIRRRLVAATGKSPSARTVRRYGKERRVKDARTAKHTIQERQSMHTAHAHIYC
jgi:transposase